MRKVNAEELRVIEGGLTTSYTARCKFCKKKYTASLTYSVFNIWGALTYPSLVKSTAGLKAKKCYDADVEAWIKSVRGY